MLEKRRLFVKGNGSVIRDPARPTLGPEDKNADPNYYKVISLANDAFAQHGPDCLERVYQTAINNSAWFRENNVSCLMEPPIDVVHVSDPYTGRVDLEVAGCYLFELKATPCTERNVEWDRLQLEMYIQAYAVETRVIVRAALVYFTPTGVVVVPVYCHWIKKDRDVASLENSLQQLSV